MKFANNLLLLLVGVERAVGHGSLVIPQVRNSIDRLAPQWRGGYPTVPDFPGTGRWGLANESCGSHPPSCQEGCSCSNGCATCDGDGRRDGDACRCKDADGNFACANA